MQTSSIVFYFRYDSKECNASENILYDLTYLSEIGWYSFYELIFTKWISCNFALVIIDVSDNKIQNIKIQNTK